jgi:hypothetical protein
MNVRAALDVRDCLHQLASNMTGDLAVLVMRGLFLSGRRLDLLTGRPRDQVALRIHALLICDVVLSLLVRGWRLTARPLPACGIIGLKLLERDPVTREHHHARPHGGGGAGCKERDEDQESDLSHSQRVQTHLGGGGSLG